ncbi:type VII secretion target [Nocardia beijingensis]|uniref:type VII secretion target n=1 Tax=Nocardia beijingensis TaxID=95162 RepID=UPI00082B9736|nr:type VII secretion target [Nocardia beijingensis]
MNVNPAELRALAASMDKIGGDIGALTVRATTDALGGVLPGSALSEACATAGSNVENAWRRMAMRCKRVSNIAKGGAANYEVSDQEFRAGLDAMGAQL